jgi:hypothetical protein
MNSVTDNGWGKIGQSTLVTGTVAAIVSAAALAALAKAEGKGALQPLNATSHWVSGDAAANAELPSADHTLVGFLTHWLSAVFWAAPFEAWMAARPPRSLSELAGDAAVMSGIAAAVDYGATPKRFTPGWELVLSKRGLFAGYAALAFGLAAGTLLAERLGGASRRFGADGTWRGARPLLSSMLPD